MKWLCAGAAVALVACSTAGFADDLGNCGHPLEAPLRSRAQLLIDARPAGIDIVGSDSETIRVSCTSNDSDLTHHVQLRFSGGDEFGKLTVTAPFEHGGLQIRVEVPRKTNLRIHTPAGQVTVEHVVGDKDIDLCAGQITISSTEAWNYRSIDASVIIGDVRASAYGIDKGGFFRSFTKEIPDGDYRIRAHLITGQIDLQ
jgi:hypothetical protein